MGKRIRLLSIDLDLGMDLLLDMGDLRLDHEHETQDSLVFINNIACIFISRSMIHYHLGKESEYSALRWK